MLFKGNGVVSYGEIQEQSRGALRRAVLDAATELLISKGTGGLTMRAVAESVGASTTVLYTLFGGKQGLIEELWAEGVARLWQAEQEAQQGADDPLARLVALGSAYRRNALENPGYYRMMFGGNASGFTPSAAAIEQRHATFQPLIDAAAACIRAGIFRPEDPERIALILWATAHGVVSLQLSGDIPEDEAEEIYSQALRAVASSFFAQPPVH